MGWTVRGSNPGDGEIFHTRPDRLWGPPNVLDYKHQSPSRGVKRLGRGVEYPTPSNEEVEEGMVIYLYSPSGPSWPVTGRILLLHFTSGLDAVEWSTSFLSRSKVGKDPQ